MEKNVTIIDESGNVIGETYPKRAKGLIRKGRAEPVSEFCIRMPDTHVPTVANNIHNTEELNMSKVIGFEARGFQIDPTCKGNNVATRMFVTDALGNNVEVYEIGDHGSNWTQISYEMPVEKDEDYEFLFAMTGDIDVFGSDSVKCNFIIMPIHEADPDKDWDNRYQYSLLNRDYKPTMEKVWNGSSIRFYRIPFNTGDADKIRFVFTAFQRPYKVFPVKNFEEYKALEDYDPERGWHGFKNGFKRDFGRDFKRDFERDFRRDFGNKGPHFTWNGGPKDFKEAEKAMGNIGAIVSKAIKDALEGIDKSFKHPNTGNGPDFSKANGKEKTGNGEKGRIVSPEELTNILDNLNEDEGKLDLANCIVESSPDFVPGSEIDTEIVDDFTFSLDNSIVDASALYRILSKVGDDCTIDANNCILGTVPNGMEIAGGFGSISDDTSFHLVNSQISGAAFFSIISKVGDGCYVDFTNSEIMDYEKIDDISGFFREIDGTEIRLDNATIPSRFYQAMVKCLGDGSKINGTAVIV